MPSESRHQGNVVSYNTERGYGFIESKDFNQPLFFHFTYLEGVENNPLYRELYNGDDIKKILVSFVAHQEERGLQARQIRIASEFADLDDFIKSPKALDPNALNEFIKIATMSGIIHIDNDPGLAQFTVQRIIHSPEKWTNLVNLARDWILAVENFKNIISSTKNDHLARCAENLIRVFGFDPLGKIDVQSAIPCGIQFIDNIASPLRVFRETKNTSLNIFPDFAALERAHKKDHNFVISNRSEFKLVVLLDETGLDYEEFRQREDVSFALIKQNTIIQSVVMDKEQLPIILGRSLRKVLPIEKLQPYQVGSEYDPSIFSGRSREREKILEDIFGNYAIYGGRKIGKTWFLKDIRSRCLREPYKSIYLPFYVSLQSAKTPDDAALSVIDVLEEFTNTTSLTEAKNPLSGLVNAIRKVNKESGKTVLLALDELDYILKRDVEGDFFGKLRGLQQTYPGTCKFIFAGFKELIYAFSDVASNNPFAHWIGKNHFPLGCLDEQDLQSLIVSPLRWAGYEFSSQSVVKTIYGLTSGHPYYTQSLCHTLVSANLEKDSLKLNSDKIEQLASDEFFTEVFDIFLLNLSALQLLIGKVFSTYSSGDAIPFSDVQIAKALKEKFGFDFTQGQIREQMKILQACSVFTNTAEGYKPVIQRINQEFFKKQNDDDLAYTYLKEVEKRNLKNEV
jgi:cold shock CspA family protein/Cdc6-like AAA superfamily ATPase